MTTVSDAELLRLAEAATPEFIGGDRVGGEGYEHDCQLCGELFIGEIEHTTCDGCERQEAFRRAANPSRIKSLLSEKAELEREVERLREALLGVLSAAEHAYHTASFPDPDGGDWWSRIKAARQALSPNNPAGQAMEGDHG